jgi:hypothetical protein
MDFDRIIMIDFKRVREADVNCEHVTETARREGTGHPV